MSDDRSVGGRLSRADELILREIELCQQHINTSSSRAWQSGGLILAGTLAALGLMAQITESNLAAAVITSLFSVGAILVLLIWIHLIRRERALQHESVARMRELERSIDFHRQRLIEQKDEAFPPFLFVWDLGTTGLLSLTGVTVIVGWVSLVAWRWLIHFGLLD